MRTLTDKLFQYSVITGTADTLASETVNMNDIPEQSLTGFYGVFSGRGIVTDIEIPTQPICKHMT